MREHRAPGWVSVQTVQGTLRYRAAGETVEVSTGNILVLDRGLRHDVEAVEESAFLLSIAGAS